MRLKSLIFQSVKYEIITNILAYRSYINVYRWKNTSDARDRYMLMQISLQTLITVAS